jgi:hypothetical protein
MRIRWPFRLGHRPARKHAIENCTGVLSKAELHHEPSHGVHQQIRVHCHDGMLYPVAAVQRR